MGPTLTKYLHFAINVVVQLALLIFAYYMALSVYRHYFEATLDSLPIYFSFLGIFLGVYFTLMWNGFYAHSLHSYLKVSIIIVVKNLLAALLAVLLSVSVQLALITDLDLVFWKVLIFFGFGFATLFLIHLLYYFWLKSLSLHGYFHKKVMLVGRSSSRFHVENFFQDMGETKEFCGTLSNIVDEPEKWGLLGNNRLHHRSDSLQTNELPNWAWDKRSTWDPDYAHQGQAQFEYYHDFMDVIYKHHIGEILIFLGPRLSEKVLQKLIHTCEKHAIGYYIVPDLSSLPENRYWEQMFSYIPIVVRKTTKRDNLLRISIKRLFDIGISALVLLFFLPFGLIISLLIFLSDFGPVFYISQRVGKDGQIIPFFKFRSMHKNAEQMKVQLLSLNERKGDGPLFKMKNDPRVTRIGRFLRRTSLDEFPQFMNVLLGHLSIVGPRPHLQEEVACYVGKDFMRLECMPGITCLPQLRDRDKMGFHEWVNFDLYYRKHWSLTLDLFIFWKTGLLFLRSFFESSAPGNSQTQQNRETQQSEQNGQGEESDTQASRH